jgi:Na+(H+)/acetate symporter ActP
VGFLVTWIISLLTEPPPRAIQEVVVDVRYPQMGKT